MWRRSSRATQVGIWRGFWGDKPARTSVASVCGCHTEFARRQWEKETTAPMSTRLWVVCWFEAQDWMLFDASLDGSAARLVFSGLLLRFFCLPGQERVGLGEDEGGDGGDR